MNPGPVGIGLIVLAVMPMSGYRKLPDDAHSLGRSLRIVRGEVGDPRGTPAAGAGVDAVGRMAQTGRWIS